MTTEQFFRVPRTVHHTSAGLVELPILYFDASNVIALFEADLRGATQLLEPQGLEPASVRDGKALLADAYSPAAERVLPIDPAMDALITLVFDGRALGFQLHDRAALRATRDSQAHGLDELHTSTLAPSAPARLHWTASAEWIAVAIAADQLALVALALGAVDGAHALARSYAAQRRQAGRPIDRHAAVQMLLANSRAQIESTRGALDSCAARPLSRARFGSALRVRVIAMPALAEAAHACMQVFGGLGYMRDTGIERVARNVNALRALAGTPSELALVLAEWERLHV